MLFPSTLLSEGPSISLVSFHCIGSSLHSTIWNSEGQLDSHRGLKEQRLMGIGSWQPLKFSARRLLREVQQRSSSHKGNRREEVEVEKVMPYRDVIGYGTTS